jgi:hypothetical protein
MNTRQEGNGAVSPSDVRIDSGGCSLAATYLDAAEPVAAALLIQGSGRTDRNSDVRLPGGFKLRGGVTRAVAEALGAVGVCTLRFDKRGVGASGGDYISVGMDQRAADVSAARDWLAAKTSGLPLLAIGHSEGTYYAAQLAADGLADGIVLLSGSARPGSDVLTYQVTEIGARLPASARLILRLMRTDVERAQRKNLAKILASQADVIRLQGQRVGARWVRDFVAYDPAPVLARVTVLRGPRGYRRQTRQPVSPEVLRLITDWVTNHCGRS